MTDIITVNDVVGSHQELIQTNNTPPPIRAGKKQSTPLIKQHITHDRDINIAQPTVFLPPYQKKPDDVNIIQGTNTIPNTGNV